MSRGWVLRRVQAWASRVDADVECLLFYGSPLIVRCFQEPIMRLCVCANACFQEPPTDGDAPTEGEAPAAPASGGIPGTVAREDKHMHARVERAHEC